MFNRRPAPSVFWGTAFVLAAGVIALLGPALAPHDPLAGDWHHRLEAPSWRFPLGTDQLGRCQLSRTVAAARLSLGLAFAIALVVTGIGLTLGTLAAFGGRLADRIVQVTINMFISFPSLVLALAMVGLMGPSAFTVAAAIAWSWWPADARLARSLLHTARHRDFVDAAWLSGVSGWRLFLRHILPQVGPPLAVRFSLELGGVVLALSTLSFLGLGAQPPYPEWGVMLNEARPFVISAPHLLLGPGLGLVVTALGCNLLAEGLRERFDTRALPDW